MKRITRENMHVDRVACPWRIRRFVDPHDAYCRRMILAGEPDGTLR
jgi:hypothetical protein